MIRRRSPHRPARLQYGAALLTALLIVVLVTTIAAAMLWRQARSIQIESAERYRSQADWVLQGALDWARLIISEDSRANKNSAVDHLGEVWAVPLAEASLASFLSTDDNHSADNGPDAYMSGHIEDAQSHYDLYNLIQTDAKLKSRHLAIAARLFTAAGLSSNLAESVQNQLIAAALNADSTSPLLPTRISQLSWLGLSTEQIERLRPLVVILPTPSSSTGTTTNNGTTTTTATSTFTPRVTLVNVNTAPREVIAALADNISLSSADRLISTRATKAYTTPDTAASDLNVESSVLTDVAGVTTNYFFVVGQLRIDDRAIIQRSLVYRPSVTSTGTSIKVLDREHLQQYATQSTTTGLSR